MCALLDASCGMMSTSGGGSCGGGMRPPRMFVGFMLDTPQQASSLFSSSNFLQAPGAFSGTPGAFCGAAYPSIVSSPSLGCVGQCYPFVVEPVLTPWTSHRHSGCHSICSSCRGSLTFEGGATESINKMSKSHKSTSSSHSAPDLTTISSGAEPSQSTSHGTNIDSGFSDGPPQDPGDSWDAKKEDPAKRSVMPEACAERLRVRLPPEESTHMPHPVQTPPSLQLSPSNLSMLIKSGFYYPHLSMELARSALRNAAVGTFLLRDSSHPGYILSLSVKTPRGVTSVRIHYHSGQFKLDTADKSLDQLPKFTCPLQLMQFYVRQTEQLVRGNQSALPCVWAESSGRRDTPMLLQTPHRDQPLTLADLARRTVNKHTDNRDINTLSLPRKDKDYLREYPFWL